MTPIEIASHPRVLALASNVRRAYFALLVRGPLDSAVLDRFLLAIGDAGDARAGLVAAGLLTQPLADADPDAWEACAPDALDASDLFPSTLWHERVAAHTRRAVELADANDLLGVLSPTQWNELMDYVARAEF